MEPDPYQRTDGSFISISGTVETVRPDRFTLDYGDGSVLVEMDDGDRDADAYALVSGDKVTVTGKIDDDFWEFTKIEAASVFVENLGTTFFADWADEEGWEGYLPTFSEPVEISRLIIKGTVESVSGDQFVIDTGDTDVRVDVDTMAYNPLDDEGYLKIEKGDRLKVKGRMDTSLLTGREMKAHAIVKLHDG